MPSPKHTNFYSVLAADLRNEIKKKGKHNVMLGGFEFVVLPNVFPPDFHEEIGNWRDQVLDNIPKPNKTDFEFMEMGSASGAICSAYYLRHHEKMKRVIGVDINPEAVANTKINFAMHRINGGVICSDLFEKLDCMQHKVDMIYTNLPWILLDDDANVEMLMKSIADPGYQVFKRFFKDVHNYLKPHGRVIMTFSSDIADMDAVKAIADDYDQQLIKVYEGSLKKTGHLRNSRKVNGHINGQTSDKLTKAMSHSVLPQDVADEVFRENNPKVELFELVRYIA